MNVEYNFIASGIIETFTLRNINEEYIFEC